MDERKLQEILVIRAATSTPPPQRTLSEQSKRQLNKLRQEITPKAGEHYLIFYSSDPEVHPTMLYVLESVRALRFNAEYSANGALAGRTYDQEAIVTFLNQKVHPDLTHSVHDTLQETSTKLAINHHARIVFIADEQVCQYLISVIATRILNIDPPEIPLSPGQMVIAKLKNGSLKKFEG